MLCASDVTINEMGIFLILILFDTQTNILVHNLRSRELVVYKTSVYILRFRQFVVLNTSFGKILNKNLCSMSPLLFQVLLVKTLA